MAVTEKVINEMINKNVSKMANRVVDFFKDQIQKGKVDYNVAFTNYLERAYDKYHRIKTLIYKTEPKELYSFFVCNTLFLDKQEIDARDINNVLDIS